MDTQTASKKTETPFQIIVADMKRREQQVSSVLPRHVPSDKFHRILIAVLSTSPDLVKAATSSPDARVSLNREVMKAAQDGLVLDGREAALVKFVVKRKDENGHDKYVDELKYMPMAQGVLKRMRNSGEIASIECEVVYENDIFRHTKGDEASIVHIPYYSREDGTFDEPGSLKFAYVSAKLKDGTRVREIMTRFDIARVKARSRSKDKQGNPTGPWRDDEAEMWRKSVLHRAAKYLPKSSDKENGADVVELLDRDNEMYDVVDGDTGEVTQERKPRAPRTQTAPGQTIIEATAEETDEPGPKPKPSPKKAETKPPVKQPDTPTGERRSAADALNGDGDEDPEDLI